MDTEPDKATRVIAHAVKALRIEKGLSQQALADKSGISQTTIDKIEKGQIKRPRYLPEIAKALGVAMSTIDPRLRSIEEQQPNDRENTQVIATRIASEYRADHIPIFASFNTAADIEKDVFEEEFAGLGPFTVASVPFRSIERPKMLGSDKEAYGVYVSEGSMSPEFEMGDILFVSPSTPIARDVSCVFYGKLPKYGNFELAIMGRLIGQTEDHWDIEKWKPPHRFSLAKKVYARVHRVALRHIR